MLPTILVPIPNTIVNRRSPKYCSIKHLSKLWYKYNKRNKRNKHNDRQPQPLHR